MMRAMLFLAVSLLVGLGGCGPGVSGESSASPPSGHSPVAATTITLNPSTEADGYRPVAAATPAPGIEQNRIVPDWMQTALEIRATEVLRNTVVKESVGASTPSPRRF